MCIKGVAAPINGALKIDYDSTNGLRVYRHLYNAHTASRAAGLACFYDMTVTSLFGMQVKQAATANLNQLAGVHTETVTSGAWAWVQAEGYYSALTARRYGAATTDSAAAAQTLIGINAVDALAYGAAAAAAPTYPQTALRLESAASHASVSSTTTATKAYIKCF